MTSALERFLDTFRRHPEREAILDLTGAEPLSLSYGRALDAAAAIAARLEGQGVVPGDRIAALLPNGADFALVYLACLIGGFTVVPLNPQAPESVLTHALGLVRPKLMLCRAETAARMSWPGPIWTVTAADLLADGPAADMVGDDTRQLAIFFTSGTASRPKGVCHRAGGMLSNVMEFNAMAGLGPATRMLHVMPMSYMAGFLNTILSPLAAGGTVVVAPPFSAATALTFWKKAADGRVNTVWLTPTMLALLTQITRDPIAPSWAGANLSHVFVGTAPLPPAIREGFEGRFGVRCRESYGMTEVLLVGVQDPASPSIGTVGRPLPGIVLQARGEDDAALAADERGELWINSPFAFAGYLDPETGADPETRATGWFPTGDVGCLNAAGELFITDRKKDILIRGGTNISPRAVEEVLLDCAGVRDVAVIGLPHPFWGEEVAALIELMPGASLDTVRAEAATRCRAVLPADAMPSRWQAVVEFPRSSTGKIQKGGLKDLFS